MSRAIDADALIYGLRDYTFTLNPDDPNATKEYSLVSKMIEILENAPTIEPVDIFTMLSDEEKQQNKWWGQGYIDALAERKKGKWINHRCDDGHHIADCNQCGHSLQWFDDDIPKYCCECGAKMEGKG